MPLFFFFKGLGKIIMTREIFSYYVIYFLFADNKHKFTVLEHMFRTLEYMFKDLEQRISLGEKKKYQGEKEKLFAAMRKKCYL